MKIALSIAVMAVITYIIRALPITVFKREITSPFLKSFLYYIPYSVLSAMTFPSILYSTGGDIKSAAVGSAAALVMGFLGQSLVATAIVAALAAFVAALFI